MTGSNSNLRWNYLMGEGSVRSEVVSRPPAGLFVHSIGTNWSHLEGNELRLKLFRIMWKLRNTTFRLLETSWGEKKKQRQQEFGRLVFFVYFQQFRLRTNCRIRRMLTTKYQSELRDNFLRNYLLHSRSPSFSSLAQEVLSFITRCCRNYFPLISLHLALRLLPIRTA